MKWCSETLGRPAHTGWGGAPRISTHRQRANESNKLIMRNRRIWHLTIVCITILILGLLPHFASAALPSSTGPNVYDWAWCGKRRSSQSISAICGSGDCLIRIETSDQQLCWKTRFCVSASVINRCGESLGRPAHTGWGGAPRISTNLI